MSWKSERKYFQKGGTCWKSESEIGKCFIWVRLKIKYVYESESDTQWEWKWYTVKVKVVSSESESESVTQWQHRVSWGYPADNDEELQPLQPPKALNKFDLIFVDYLFEIFLL